MTEADNKTKIDDDGIEMEWIEEKKAWFPKITDEFIYMRNLNYGFLNDEVQSEIAEQKVEEPPKELPEWFQRLSKDFQKECEGVQKDGVTMSENEYSDRWSKFYQYNCTRYEREQQKIVKESKKRSAKPNDVGWFEMDEDKNKFVYVENLPLDITLDEFVKEMSKVGMVMNDFHTHQPKARLYKCKDDESKNKGDGIICYLKVESIDLAMDILDGSKLRGNEIKVSRAKFEQKEGFNPNKRRKLTNKEKKKMREHQEKLFRWAPDTGTVRPKKDNTVILKNVFDFQLMKDNPEMAFDIKEKLSKAVQQIGKVRSIQVHDLQEEGIVQINFTDPNDSDVAVTYFNNKLWDGRTITASLWDGKTKYKIKETEEQEKERLEKWNKTLKGETELKNGGNDKDGEVDNDDDSGSETGDEDADSN